MRLQRQSNDKIITLNLSSTLGHGGEARIYAVPLDQTLVAAKVYHKPTEAHSHKLSVMVANPPDNPMAEEWHIAIAWPFDLLRTMDDSQQVVGFLMPCVKGMYPILDFYNPKTRRQKCPFFNYRYLHRAASNLAAAVNALHARGYCIGDVNESNVLVSDTALVTLVDTDSFQVRAHDGIVHRCPVGKPEFTPPELQGKSFGQLDRTPEHDLFGLAVLIFQLLMEGSHPFSGIYQGIGDPPPYEARIAAGHFPYSTSRSVPYKSTPVTPSFEILHPTLRQLFMRCFDSGHDNPLLRPTAKAWRNALIEAENALVICAVNNQHRYGKHMKTCPWCTRTLALGGRDPFPSLQAVKTGQHLQPIKPKPKRVVPTVKTGLLLAPTSSTQLPILSTNLVNKKFRPTQVPLLTTNLVSKKFSPFALGLLGIAVLGCLELLVVVTDPNPITDFIVSTLFPTTKNIALPSSANSGNNFVADHNQSSEAAIEKFNRVLRLNPNDAKAYLQRGKAHYEIARHSADRDRDYKAAIADFNQALRLDPQLVEAYLKRGIVRYEIALYSGDSDNYYRAAIDDFSHVLLLNPHSAEAYFKRGTVRYEVAPHDGDADRDSLAAIEDLRKAAKLFLEQGDMERYQQVLAVCQRERLDNIKSCQF